MNREETGGSGAYAQPRQSSAVSATLRTLRQLRTFTSQRYSDRAEHGVLITKKKNCSVKKKYSEVKKFFRTIFFIDEFHSAVKMLQPRLFCEGKSRRMPFRSSVVFAALLLSSTLVTCQGKPFF